MPSPTSSPPLPTKPLRWRQIADHADPEKVRALTKATGVFSVEEQQVAGDLVDSTLSGTEPYRFLFAERGDILLGYTCFDRIPLSAVSFDLFWIAVAPEARGTGLARELMTRTAAFIRRKRGLFVFAETSSREPYAAARAFYLRAGFDEVARFDDFYEPGDAKVIYRLKLG